MESKDVAKEIDIILQSLRRISHSAEKSTIVSDILCFGYPFSKSLDDLISDCEYWKESISGLFYDWEHDKYFTREELECEYDSNDDLQESFPSFCRWIEEITGKNGTLEKV